MKNVRKIFFHLAFSLVLAAIDRSFASALPEPLRYMNLSVIIIVWTELLFGLESAMIRAASIGFFMSIYSFLPFGVSIAGFFMASIAAHILSGSVFTNRSLYSLIAIVFVATLIFQVIQYPFMKFDGLEGKNFAFSALFFLKTLYGPILSNIALALISFQLFNYASERFRPVLDPNSRSFRYN
jgi:hypothetical protein